MIQAIETRYAGCRFRSRLEARWAVFFDALGITWEYEPQGYLVGPPEDRRPYLPDFYLTGLGLWVEVKGDRSKASIELLAHAAHGHYGLPGPTSGNRILLLGNIPRVEHGWVCWHQVIEFHKGDYIQHIAWFKGDDLIVESLGLTIGCDGDDFTNAPSRGSFWNFDAFVTADDPLATRWPSEWKAYRAARSARFEHGESGA